MSDRSAELYLKAREYIAGGVSRNTLKRDPHPLYADRAYSSSSSVAMV